MTYWKKIRPLVYPQEKGKIALLGFQIYTDGSSEDWADGIALFRKSSGRPLPSLANVSVGYVGFA